MAIQYYMRAFNTSLNQYVDWIVNDTPDSTGAFSGFPANQLTNITVNRVVQSKVANFLKPNQSRGGTDGYFFHVNSYDWINATAPQTAVPLTFTGFAIERGVTSVAAISTASNTSPINITTATPHGLVTGQIVTIIGVTGNINANGTWPITVTGGTNFTLNGSAGSGAPNVLTGNVYTPKDMSTLIWDETNQLWRFVLNTNGDGVTLGASQSVKVNNFLIDGYEALGSPTASQGIIRLPNNQYIFARQSSNLGDVQLIGADTFITPTGSNRIKLGGLSTDVVYTPGIIDVDGYIQHDGALGNVAQVGFIREQNATNIIAFRAVSGLSDVVALSSNSLNDVILGDATNGSVLYNTSTGNIHQFQVNSVPQVEIGTSFIRFANGVTLPTILQTAASVGINGQTLTVQAQNAAGAGTATGGNVNITSGTGSPGNPNGVLNLQTGGITRITISDAGGGANTGTETYFLPNVTFANTVAAPIISQATTTGVTGQTMTLQSQNSSNAGGTGGAMFITSGSATAAANAGYVRLQTGGTDQLIVTPVNLPAKSFPTTGGKVTITGNLEVQGTLTTVDSTTVDIVGAVIHGNWADPAVSFPVSVPVTVAGYAVHRGNLAQAQPRDAANWIWTESTTSSTAALNAVFGVSTTNPTAGNLFNSDGYWRAISTPGDGFGVDGYTAFNSFATLGIFGNNFISSFDPNPALGTLPGVGSFKGLNNSTAVSARNLIASTTLTVAGTTPLALPQGTLNVVSTTGFTSPTGTLFVQSSTGTQTITYTNTTGTSFTGCVGGSGNIVTGGIVGQAIQTTTIAASSNNVQLPTTTINVASVVGFPQTGTLRIVTYGGPATPGVPGNGSGIVSVNYTGVTGTTPGAFTGCTVATGSPTGGFLYTNNTVQLASISGNADLLLLGSDFGNHIIHGGLANTGQIFNTATGGVYDFWVNGVSQIQLGNADFDADGYAETVQISPTVSNPRIYQLVQPYTGANAGFNMLVQAQAGQQQTGGANNNNGGILTLASGAAGTGGGGTAGVAGVVTINVGSVNNSTFNNIDPDADGYAEWLAVGPTLVNPRLYQATLPGTGTAVGTNFKINAQAGQNVSAGTNNNGGNLVLASGTPGTGGTGGTAGQVEIFYGSTLELTLTDGTLQWSNLIGNPPTISQAGGVTTGQQFTIQAQNASTTGGNLALTSGTGTTAGNVRLQTGGADRVIVQPTFTNFLDTAEAFRITPVSAGTTQLTYASTVTAAQINQTQTAATPSATMTIQSQVTTAASGQGGNLALIAGNASGTTSTGGNLNLASGSGTTANGVINFQPGGTTQILITSTGQFIQWVSTLASPTLNQATTGGASGQTLTVQAQNAATTGGNLALTSGTGGTTAGNVVLQTGGTPRVTVTPTNTQFADTATALTITPVSAGTTQITFAATDTAAQINQTATGGATGATMTVAAQNATTTGGNLNLTSGTGTTAGTVNLQVGGSTNASVTDSKFVFNKGKRRNVTSVTSAYAVQSSDDYLAVDSTTAPFTITMPSAPTTGDEYQFKDVTGKAGINNVNISGNGNNIDGVPNWTLNTAYESFVFTFTGSQWSVS